MNFPSESIWIFRFWILVSWCAILFARSEKFGTQRNNGRLHAASRAVPSAAPHPAHSACRNSRGHPEFVQKFGKKCSSRKNFRRAARGGKSFVTRFGGGAWGPRARHEGAWCISGAAFSFLYPKFLLSTKQSQNRSYSDAFPTRRTACTHFSHAAARSTRSASRKTRKYTCTPQYNSW